MSESYKIEVYKSSPGPSAKIRPLNIQREWMDSGVYHCIPIAVANKIGYGIYFEEDLSFRLDSKNASAYSTNENSFLWSGESLTKGAYGRNYGTASFEPNLIFKTDEDVSLMTMPVPNQILENATVVSTLLSTSFFTASLPIVWKLHKEDHEYFIPAGTDIAAVLPISLGSLQNCEMNYYDYHFPYERINSHPEYLSALSKKMNSDGRSSFYKKATDHNNNKIGKHEVDKFNLFLNEKSSNE
jgi:hypothetical protein